MTHWGVLLYGAPYAVPIDKGYYKELGLYIDGVLTSQGGGTTMRNVMASSLPYGEVALSAGIKRGHMVDDALQSRFELAEWARQAVDDSINSARCFGRRSQSVIVRIGASARPRRAHFLTSPRSILITGRMAVIGHFSVFAALQRQGR